MNDRKKTPIDDLEWEAQERGLRAARDGGKGATDTTDAAAESYRRVAVALVHAPRSEPPADFVSGVVEQTALQDAGIERLMLRGLLLILAVSSIIVVALYGGQWWRAMQETLTGGALQWVLAGAGCVTLSWMFRRLQPAPHVGV